MTEVEKNAVLENIIHISEGELYYNYIKPGYISLERMQRTGNLDARKRKEILTILAQEEKKEDEFFAEIDKKHTREGYSRYLSEYPDGKYRVVAEAALAKLKQIEENQLKSRQGLLDKIKNNPNGTFTPKIITDYLVKGTLTEKDLRDAKVPQVVIDALPNFAVPNLKLGEIPETIPPGFTEVYFWGIPGSGKTCALSGILSHANRSGILDTEGGPGFHYMTQLKNIFSTDIGFLPAPTSSESTQCLPFELTDEKGRKHPIALIELSGEIFQCYYNHLSGLPFPDDDHVRTFNTITRYLNGPNRKFHFFVFDLSKVPQNKDDLGAAQDDYLKAAQIYFKNNNIFRNNTDGIYIIGTKSDFLSTVKEDRNKKAAEFLKNNYPAFVEGLKESCKKYKINDDNNLKVLAFSLGDVYFNYMCLFNSSSSGEVVSILKNKTGARRGGTSLSDFFNK